MVTQSADRTFRVYRLGKAQATEGAAPAPCAKRLRGVSLQGIGGKWRRPAAAGLGKEAQDDAEEEGGGKGGDGKAAVAVATESLLRDENSGGFFKRLAWSPDGEAVRAGFPAPFFKPLSATRLL